VPLKSHCYSSRENRRNRRGTSSRTSFPFDAISRIRSGNVALRATASESEVFSFPENRKSLPQHARCYPCESREYPPVLLTRNASGSRRGKGGREVPLYAVGPAVRAPALFSRRDKIGTAKNSARADRRGRCATAFSRYHEFTMTRAGRIFIEIDVSP